MEPADLDCPARRSFSWRATSCSSSLVRLGGSALKAVVGEETAGRRVKELAGEARLVRRTRLASRIDKSGMSRALLIGSSGASAG